MHRYIARERERERDLSGPPRRAEEGGGLPVARAGLLLAGAVGARVAAGVQYIACVQSAGRPARHWSGPRREGSRGGWGSTDYVPICNISTCVYIYIYIYIYVYRQPPRFFVGFFVAFGCRDLCGKAELWLSPFLSCSNSIFCRQFVKF